MDTCSLLLATRHCILSSVLSVQRYRGRRVLFFACANSFGAAHKSAKTHSSSFFSRQLLYSQASFSDICLAFDLNARNSSLPLRQPRSTSRVSLFIDTMEFRENMIKDRDEVLFRLLIKKRDLARRFVSNIKLYTNKFIF